MKYLRLKLSESFLKPIILPEISEILLFASGMKPRSPGGVSEKPEIPAVSIRQPGTRRQVGDPGSAAQFDSLMRY